jgi:FtsH-binding integral membrane protein
MLGGFTSNFKKELVITATLGTAMVTIALTLYAMTSRVEIEVFMGLVWVVYMAEFPLLIVGLFLGLSFVHVIYCLIGITFYSLFLIIDTKIICNSNKSMGGFDIDYDDYILCSL